MRDSRLPNLGFEAVCSSPGMSGRGGDSSRESHLVRRSFSHQFNFASDVFSISTEGGGVGVPAVIGRAINSMCLAAVLHETWDLVGEEMAVLRRSSRGAEVERAAYERSLRCCLFPGDEIGELTVYVGAAA